MTNEQLTAHLKLLRKVLEDIAPLAPHHVTEAYIERRLAEETARLTAN